MGASPALANGNGSSSKSSHAAAWSFLLFHRSCPEGRACVRRKELIPRSVCRDFIRRAYKLLVTMKRTTSTSTHDAPDYKAPVVKEHKVPIETSKLWVPDPLATTARADDDVRRKAPEMKFMYVVSGVMTVLVIWGVIREVSYRFPLVLYGPGNPVTVERDVLVEKVHVTAANVGTVHFKDDPITSRTGRKDARRFLQKYPFSLGPKITDWDQQRQDYAASIEAAGSPKKKSEIFLVSGQQPTSCPNAMGDHYYLKFFKNRVDYCRLHGITNHLYNMADIDEGVNHAWKKLPVLRALMLKHRNVEWFLWIDGDALITNMNYEVPLDRYKKHNFVVHGSKDLVYEKKQASGLSTASFLIRNCQWSLDFLEAWATMADKEFEQKWGVFLSEHLTDRPQDQPAEDQSAAVYTLAKDPTKWSSKVYLEKDMSRFWKDTDLSALKDSPELTPPFVTHFAGCRSCTAPAGDAKVARCQAGMEKAFNFADNQVLARYGYSHSDLSSYIVKPLRTVTKQ
ncbi:hypothetical protein R1flu_012191 [Riccia fluitans]|uniref:Uncharacterized protein n=1 Tax=Riccia fluitans TaxID=41844 RepID=A0ABD1ZB28_9MARC